jgi:deoxyadenosine/deoxycytidine kinase
VDFRYLAIEGPLALGKATLAERLGARLNANVVLDESTNPFLDDFYSNRDGAAFQAQLFFTLNRHRQQLTLRQGDLFNQTTISDYVFDRDRIYAFMNLDDNELFIYQRLFDLLSRDVPVPDLVVYLQAKPEVLRARLRERAAAADEPSSGPSDEYIGELSEAYNHFFFHYTTTPLLVVETSHLDLTWGDEAIDELVRQIRAMGKGTQYFVPRTS